MAYISPNQRCHQLEAHKATYTKWQPQQPEILQDVWVAPKAMLCMQEHWGKRLEKPTHPYGFCCCHGDWEIIVAEFQLAYTCGLPVKSREPLSWRLCFADNYRKKKATNKMYGNLPGLCLCFFACNILDTIMMCTIVHLTIVLPNHLYYKILLNKV